MLQVLRNNTNTNQRADGLLRRAIQFNVFKHRLFVMKQTFRILKSFRFQKQSINALNEKKIYYFRLQTWFNRLLKAVKKVEEDDMTLLREHQSRVLRVKFFQMWKYYLNKRNDLNMRN